MTTPTPSRWSRWEETCSALIRRPWLLLALLLLCNTLARPYAGLIHDACLYGAQTMHRLDGSFADDLYFRYGSQDSYSVFSTVAQLAVSAFGVEHAFFLLHIIGNGLFFLALLRLTIRLVESPVHTLFALLFVATSPVWFGGHHVFQVNEPFLTPRIFSNALILFSCERMLAGRMGGSLALIVFAMLLHPLMAFVGLLMWTLTFMLHNFSTRTVVSIVAGISILGLFVVLMQPVGRGLFGEMDAEWKDAAECVSFYACITQWPQADWIRSCTALALILASAFWNGNSARRRFSIALLIIGVAAIAGSFAADWACYALLFQGQPFRWLWLGQLLAIPLGMQLSSQLWRSSKTIHQMMSIGILFNFAFTSQTTAIWGTGVLGVALLGRAILLNRSSSSDRRLLAYSAVFVFSCLSLLTIVGVAYLIPAKVQAASDFIEPLFCYRVMFLALGPGLSALLAGGLCLLGARGLSYRRLSPLIAAFVYLSAATALYVVPNALNTRLQMYRDIDFVKSALPADQTLTVHWPHPSPRFVWFQLRANSFYTWQQTSGVMFNRGTATEAVRRAHIVGRLDLATHDVLGWSTGAHEVASVLKMYDVDEVDVVSEDDDLVRVCQESEVDFLVARHKIEGLYRATNGRWFIYDCQAVRNRVSKELARASIPARCVTP